jgi:hypothetical protein
MNKTEFDNPIFEDLAAYNGKLKDLITKFQKTNLELCSVHIECEVLNPAKIERNPKLDRKTKAYLLSEAKKIPKVDEMRRCDILDRLRILNRHCEEFLVWCDNLYGKPDFKKIPVHVSITESLEVIINWQSCYEEVKACSYELLGHVSFFLHNDFSQTTERLSHISKIVNSYIESMVLTAVAQGENEAGNAGKPKKKLKPLSANAAAVYELLKALLEYKAMKGREILKALENQNPSIFIDQSTLTKNIIPELRPYGVKNKPRIGYYIER